MTQKIKDLMLQLKDECIMEKIPMFVVVGEETEEGTQYDSEIVTPAFLNAQLSDDRISPLNALLSQKFRLEFIGEVKPEEIEAEIDQYFAEEE